MCVVEEVGKGGGGEGDGVGLGGVGWLGIEGGRGGNVGDKVGG